MGDAIRTVSQGIDLTDLSLFENGAPYEVFARLRSEAPVYWNELPSGAGFWALTRHAEVQALGRDPFTFSVAKRGNMIFDQFVEESARAPMLLELDPPEHTRYRSLVKSGFSPETVRRLLPMARARMSEIVTAALELGDCDFVEHVAGALPLHVIADLMGCLSSSGRRSTRWPTGSWHSRIPSFPKPAAGRTWSPWMRCAPAPENWPANDALNRVTI